MLHRQRFQLWGFGTLSCLNEMVSLLAAFNEKRKHFSAVSGLCVTELSFDVKPTTVFIAQNGKDRVDI